MSQEEFDRRELNTLLDELERRQLFFKREQLTEIVFYPVRKADEHLTERLQWLLATDGFRFHSPLSREAGERALQYLAGYIGLGQNTTEQLATSVEWGTGDKQPEKI